MIARFPNKFGMFSVRPSQPVVVETTKLSHGVLKVVFDTKEQYDQTLQTPAHRLAQMAIAQGCEEMWLYVKGSSMKTALLATAVLREFGRVATA